MRTSLLNIGIGLLSVFSLSNSSSMFSASAKTGGAMAKIIKGTGKLGFPYKTQDPFLFAVHHEDKYPVGNDKCEAPRKGNGMDFEPRDGYRMYHGEKVPGFPQHPHRGFETVTLTIHGFVDLTDSLGYSARFGAGDAHWMTAGEGVVHGEVFPLVYNDKPNFARSMQIWLNLPQKNKMCPPIQDIHWRENIPVHKQEDGAFVNIYSGEYAGLKAIPPPPHSWAADPNNFVQIYFATVPKGASLTLPSRPKGINCSLFFVRGTAILDGSTQQKEIYVDVHDGPEFTITNDNDEVVEFILLQGRPIGEPVVQQGPFVMNSRAEIQQAHADYYRTGFGGWPWPKEIMVFPRETGRFLKKPDGTTETRDIKL